MVSRQYSSHCVDIMNFQKNRMLEYSWEESCWWWKTQEGSITNTEEAVWVVAGGIKWEHCREFQQSYLRWWSIWSNNYEQGYAHYSNLTIFKLL